MADEEANVEQENEEVSLEPCNHQSKTLVSSVRTRMELSFAKQCLRRASRCNHEHSPASDAIMLGCSSWTSQRVLRVRKLQWQLRKQSKRLRKRSAKYSALQDLKIPSYGRTTAHSAHVTCLHGRNRRSIAS